MKRLITIEHSGNKPSILSDDLIMHIYSFLPFDYYTLKRLIKSPTYLSLLARRYKEEQDRECVYSIEEVFGPLFLYFFWNHSCMSKGEVDNLMANHYGDQRESIQRRIKYYNYPLPTIMKSFKHYDEHVVYGTTGRIKREWIRRVYKPRNVDALILENEETPKLTSNEFSNEMKNKVFSDVMREKEAHYVEMYGIRMREFYMFNQELSYWA